MPAGQSNPAAIFESRLNGRLSPSAAALPLVSARDLLGHAGHPAASLDALALEVPLTGVEGGAEANGGQPVPGARPAEVLLAAASQLEGAGEAQRGVAVLARSSSMRPLSKSKARRYSEKARAAEEAHPRPAATRSPKRQQHSP